MIIKMDKLIFVVFFTCAVCLSFMSGYMYSYYDNEVKVISNINKQLDFLDATLCRADELNTYPVRIDYEDKALNVSLENVPWK